MSCCASVSIGVAMYEYECDGSQNTPGSFGSSICSGALFALDVWIAFAAANVSNRVVAVVLGVIMFTIVPTSQ